MNHQERLFLAVGGADPELVARSEQLRRSRWLPCGLAAAACLALALWQLLPLGTEPVSVPDGQDPPPAIAPSGPEESLSLPEQGRAIGTLRLLRYAPDPQDKTVDFLIYVNEEQFAVQEENGLYQIRSLFPLPEGFPECGMDITHLSSVSPSEARLAAEEALRKNHLEISSEEPAAALPSSLYLRAGEPLGQNMDAEEFWRAKQAELWFADDGQGGTFVLTARYFLEAEEGLGACFRDMASSFRVVDLSQTVPDWMRTLYTAADRLFPALFADDLSGVSDLLAEGADVDAYGENVWADITVVSVDCALDDDRDPTEATVSVKHRHNLAEGDSFSYLTMGLVRQNEAWRLVWSGIEK